MRKPIINTSLMWSEEAVGWLVGVCDVHSAVNLIRWNVRKWRRLATQFLISSANRSHMNANCHDLFADQLTPIEWVWPFSGCAAALNQDWIGVRNWISNREQSNNKVTSRKCVRNWFYPISHRGYVLAHEAITDFVFHWVYHEEWFFAETKLKKLHWNLSTLLLINI